MWELIRWFSSVPLLDDAGWRRGLEVGWGCGVGWGWGGIGRAQPPPCSLRGKEAARGESNWDGKTGGRRGRTWRWALLIPYERSGRRCCCHANNGISFAPPHNTSLLHLIPTVCTSYNKAPPRLKDKAPMLNRSRGRALPLLMIT